MNKQKIIVTLLAIVILAGSVFYSIEYMDKPGAIAPGGSPYVSIIEKEIKQIQDSPIDRFNRQDYNKVYFHISEYHKLGKFGKTPLQNDEWKKNLEEILFGTYADLFLKQADYVFKQSAWSIEHLKLIQNETNNLISSKYYINNTPRAVALNKVVAILNKYYEISAFIASCQSYAFKDYRVIVKFPVSEVNLMIARANSLRQSLGSYLLNNCARLHNGLKEVPSNLYQAHIRYLDNKTTQLKDRYGDYPNQKTFYQEMFTPVLEEIKGFDNSLYKSPTYQTDLNRIKLKWEAENQKAFMHIFTK